MSATVGRRAYLLRRAPLKAIVAALPASDASDRDQDLARRWLDGETLTALTRSTGISRHRVTGIVFLTASRAVDSLGAAATPPA